MTVANIETHDGLADKIEFARALAGSSLLPRTYQREPANILVAMELGAALGIAPIVAINEVNVINGSPSLSASLMAALARRAGHKVRVTGDATSATCTIVRGDDPDYEHTATWDEKKARDAGLWGKGHWSKDPGTMLRWRAISECVRFACSEVLGGVKYTPEELRDAEPPTRHTVTATVPPPAAKPPSIRDAITENEAIDAAFAEPAAPAEELRTEAQSRKLAILIRENQLQRDEALAWMSGLIGRDIETTKELTKKEASQVIDALESAKADGASPVTGEVVQAEIVEDWPAVATVNQ